MGAFELLRSQGRKRMLLCTGQACAVAFAERGATLVLADISDANLQETVSMLKTGPNAKVSTHVVDICDDKAILELLRSIPRNHGRLDYALNCAGVINRKTGPMVDADQADDDWVMNVRDSSSMGYADGE